MNWERVLLGNRGSGLGRTRYPITTVLLIAITIFWAIAGSWVAAILCGFAAAIFAGLTVWSRRAA